MSDSIKYSSKGVSWPKGFQSYGLACGIKGKGILDLGLLHCEAGAKATGVFTRNQFIAAPIAHSKEILSSNAVVRSVLVNSGNANAGCGKNGKTAVRQTIRALSQKLKISSSQILAFSTGSIGSPLPVTRLTSHMSSLISGLKTNDSLFSKSILTTDAYVKTKGAEWSMGSSEIRIGACAKGAGMIEPSMATMLCFITTDLDLPVGFMKKALKKAVDVSFNRISVDGDQSTNDSVVLLSSGIHRSEKMKNPSSREAQLFQEALNHVCRDLSLQIVRDGEGATKVLHTKVEGAHSKKDAEKVCRGIANSLLLKCALFGQKPIWGRILSSVGATEAKINHARFKLFLQGILCYGADDLKMTEKKLIRLKKLMQKKDIEINIDLGAGSYSHTFASSDLGHPYVEINR